MNTTKVYTNGPQVAVLLNLLQAVFSFAVLPHTLRRSTAVLKADDVFTVVDIGKDSAENPAVN